MFNSLLSHQGKCSLVLERKGQQKVSLQRSAGCIST
jgi:hypothetical protein